MGAMDSDAIQTGMIPASKEFAVCWGVGREMEKEHQKNEKIRVCNTGCEGNKQGTEVKNIRGIPEEGRRDCLPEEVPLS